MDLGLKDKIVVVTGGTRGIGKEIVKKFSEEGSKVLFTYVSSEETANALCEETNPELVKGFKVDVKDTAGVQEFVEMVGKEYGGIDVLVNNAGIIRDTLLFTMDKQDWQDVLDTNLTGIFNTTKPAARLMMRKRYGSIINMSSIAGSRPGKGHANYAASKGGVETLTKALAAELATKKIRVNAVAPGMIETDMSQKVRDLASDQILDHILLKRFGQPEDIANAVLFLASDRSSYITGEVLHVDGGIGA